MVELRWAVPAHTTAKAPRLQYRQLPAIVSFGGPGWSEWADVPYVVVPEEPKPAPTCACGAPKRAGWTHRPGWCNEGGRADFEAHTPDGVSGLDAHTKPPAGTDAKEGDNHG